MKNLGIKSIICAGVISLSVYACDNKPSEKEDSMEIAEDTNDAKFDNTKTEDDAEFVVEAYSSGMAEVKMADLAIATAMNQGVKDFAAKIKAHHTMCNESLQKIANDKGIAYPETLGEKHQKKVNDLADKKGKDFDKEYLNEMISCHKDAIKLFEEETEEGNVADLKNFASEHLPMLKEHLAAAEKMKDSMK